MTNESFIHARLWRSEIDPVIQKPWNNAIRLFPEAEVSWSVNWSTLCKPVFTLFCNVASRRPWWHHLRCNSHHVAIDDIDLRQRARKQTQNQLEEADDEKVWENKKYIFINHESGYSWQVGKLWEPDWRWLMTLLWHILNVLAQFVWRETPS